MEGTARRFRGRFGLWMRSFGLRGTRQELPPRAPPWAQEVAKKAPPVGKKAPPTLPEAESV